MPRMDGTGPFGGGPMTGGRRGRCVSSGRNAGGYRQGGRAGFGGWNVPGGGFFRGGRGPWCNRYAGVYMDAGVAEMDPTWLKAEAGRLSEILSDVQRRIDELEKEKQGDEA